MRILKRFFAWLRRLLPWRAPSKFIGRLREFVYLDEVSVYSLLASRKKGIVTEIIESQTDSLSTDTGNAGSVNVGAAKATFDSRMQKGHAQSSQVVRKAIIQTTFKELYDNERVSLALGRPDPNSIPQVRTINEIEKIAQNPKDTWVVDPNSISRGELLEVEIELEADPVFRMASIVTIVSGILEDIDQLFGQANATQLSQLRSIPQLLEGLLFGLVPIRGRLVEYVSANIGGSDFLIHQSLLSQIDTESQLDTFSVSVVGVTQRDLFWKDYRRVLFSKARYTVFARLATGGLLDTWQPFKVAEVLSGIAPRFDESMRDFGKWTDLATTSSSDAVPYSETRRGHGDGQVIKDYATELASEHGKVLSPEFLDSLLRDIIPKGNWLNNVDSRRSILAMVTRRVDAQLGVETSSEVAYNLRDAVLKRTGLKGKLAHQLSIGTPREQTSEIDPEKFLNIEIIAIYW